MTIAMDHLVTDVSVFLDQIQAALATIRDKYPSASEIVLQPIVGGPGGESCSGPRGGVGASVMFGPINSAILLALDGDVVAGPAPTVSSCSQYVDGKGHLTQEGAAYVASLLAERYDNS